MAALSMINRVAVRTAGAGAPVPKSPLFTKVAKAVGAVTGVVAVYGLVNYGYARGFTDTAVFRIGREVSSMGENLRVDAGKAQTSSVPMGQVRGYIASVNPDMANRIVASVVHKSLLCENLHWKCYRPMESRGTSTGDVYCNAPYPDHVDKMLTLVAKYSAPRNPERHQWGGYIQLDMAVQDKHHCTLPHTEQKS